MDEKAIFLAALEKTNPLERAAFLDEACRGDGELRARVEALIRSHEKALRCRDEDCNGSKPNGVHDRRRGDEATVTAQPPGESEGAGGRIGPYKLLQKLGEGGMGVVYMAEQDEPVRRRVALKIIKAGMASDQVIARFEQERQALAMMDHPNIAKVLDAGSTEAGRPYFVMELVKGIAITRYCDQEHLTPAKRLELFIPVCQAVQHAHQKGIIHRDLKPSNILVALYDGKPVPKIIDFGVAKATHQRLTERTMFTEVGTIVGTVEYMAPEQMELNNLDIDTRADIYSLGVILYELLAGSPPFTSQQLRSAAFSEMLRIVREVEPPKPSTKISSSDELPAIAANRHLEPKRLTKFVAGDLDWIVMKCLEKERGRRYDTANALAADLEHFLHDEPVSAGPPSRIYRLRKFARRNRGGVIAAGMVLVALIGGVIGTSWQAVRARRAQLAADQEKASALISRDAEAASRQRTREALNAMTDDVIGQLLGKQLGEQEQGFLRKVLAFYEEFAQSQGETEQARHDRADGHFRVGSVHAHLGELKEAEVAFRNALDIQQGLAADFPHVAAYRQQLARSYQSLAVTLHMTGRPRESEIAYRESIVIRQKLVADFPAVPQYRQDLALSQTNLAILLNETSRPREAETAYREALALRQKLTAEFPDVAEYWQALANSHNNLGAFLHDTGRPKEAESAHREAITVRAKLVADHPAWARYRAELASSHNNLGLLLNETGRPQEAEAAFRHALTLYYNLAADFPNVPLYREDLAGAQNNLALLLREMDRLSEAEALHRDALAVQQRLAADFPQVPAYRLDLAGSQSNLGTLLAGTGRMREAEAAIREALSLRQKLADEFPTMHSYRQALAMSHQNLGFLMADSNRPKEAEAAYGESIALRRKLVAEFPNMTDYANELASTLVSMARLKHAANDHAEARKLLEEARPYHRAALQANARNPEYLFHFRLNRFFMGLVLIKLGDHVGAAAEAAELAVLGHDPAADHYDAACVLAHCARLAERDATLPDSKRPALAKTYADKAIAYLQQALAKGFYDVEHVKKDPDLEPLRGREDFRKLVKAMEQKQPAKKEAPAKK
jgi:serine/threonine protein kinase/tetratricopeptide (TPR) repeat protein